MGPAAMLKPHLVNCPSKQLGLNSLIATLPSPKLAIASRRKNHLRVEATASDTVSFQKTNVHATTPAVV